MKFRPEKCIIQRQQKSGLYTFLVRVRTEDGEISKSFNEKDFPSARVAFDTAIRFRNKAMYELSAGLVEKKSNATVDELFDEYIENSASSLKTRNHLRKLYGKYVHSKEKKIQELTKADIITDLNKMVEIASDDTIQRVFFIYKECIVGMGLLKEILSKDVTMGIKKPRSRYIVPKRGVETNKATLDTVKRGVIRSVSSRYNARVICFLLDVLYYTGMRPAEAEALTRKDVSSSHISITKELGSSMEDDNVIRNCKTVDSIREIPIHPELKPILKDLLDFVKTDKLFLKDDGEYINSTWLGNIIRRICKKENIEFNLYRLRHNMATSLVTNNVDTRTTIELMGHSNYGMSLYYATSNDDLKEEAINLIS